MNRNIFIILSIVLIFSAGIIAQKSPTEINIYEGKNNIVMNQSMGDVFVSDLVKAYPEIETITWIDKENSSNSKGYVNIFGGVGEDFVLTPNENYEIISKQNITVRLG